jgi:hypothetical protein
MAHHCSAIVILYGVEVFINVPYQVAGNIFQGKRI